MKKITIVAIAAMAFALTGCATPEAGASGNTFDQIGTLVGEIADGITGQ